MFLCESILVSIVDGHWANVGCGMWWLRCGVT